MTAQTDDTTVVRSTVEVTVPPDKAFAVFTSGIDRWWTRAHHVQSGELKEIGVDPHVGGRMWEENDAGDVCTWGRVLTWDPPQTFAFSCRVTVTFSPTDAGTHVTLVHDQLDAHGPGWESVRDGVGSDGGWPAGLRQFADAV
jgi:activator of Hsp90 ATPase-like protein